MEWLSWSDVNTHYWTWHRVNWMKCDGLWSTEVRLMLPSGHQTVWVWFSLRGFSLRGFDLLRTFFIKKPEIRNRFLFKLLTSHFCFCCLSWPYQNQDGENNLHIKHVCLANFANSFEVIFFMSGLYIMNGFIFLSFFLFFCKAETVQVAYTPQSMVSAQLTTRKEPSPLGSWQLLEFRLTPLNGNRDSKRSWCWDVSMGNTVD